jgi:hypothetical protein
MKRKQEKERYDRLSFKTRDRQFQQEAIEGLSCSPLEAKALTEIVKEVYFPLLEEKSIENTRPGQIVVQAIDPNEPPGKPNRQSNKPLCGSRLQIFAVIQKGCRPLFGGEG